MVNLSPIIGNEQEGIRPALVVSRNELDRTGLCMVVPGTRTYKNLPGRVRLPSGAAGVKDDTYLLANQLRTLSATRFLRPLGTAEIKYVEQTLAQIRFFLTIP